MLKPYTDYLRYLESPQWGRLKAEVFQKWGYECAVCGGNEDLDAHHMEYKRLYDCTVADVIPLCRRCHDLYHQGRKAGKVDHWRIVRAEGDERLHVLRDEMRKVRGRPTRGEKMKVELNRVVLRPEGAKKGGIVKMSYDEYQKRFGA